MGGVAAPSYDGKSRSRRQAALHAGNSNVAEQGAEHRLCSDERRLYRAMAARLFGELGTPNWEEDRRQSHHYCRTFELSAESATSLTGSTDPKVVGKEKSFNLEVALSYMLDSRRTGISTRIKFAGNEPEWYIPPMGQLETYQVNAKLNRCIADLRAKAADFFRRDSGGKHGDRTSPFRQ